MRTSATLITMLGFALAAQAQTPTFTSSGVVNAASSVAGAIAPGELVAINGTNLGTPPQPQLASCLDPIAKTIPTTCNGMSVLLNGNAVPVLSTGTTQLVFQVPFNLTGSTATLQVKSATAQSTSVNVSVSPTSPGLYNNGAGLAYYYVAGGFGVQFSQPVLSGNVVHLFATGLGGTNPAQTAGVPATDPAATVVANVTMTLNSQPVSVQATIETKSSVGGGTPGTYEIVFTVPSGLARGSYPMVVTAGGVQSNSANLSVASPLVSITSITPSPVPTSSTAQTVTINGSGFQNGSALQVHATTPDGNSQTLSGSQVTYVSSTQLTAQIVSGMTTGFGDIWVINGDSSQSNIFEFRVAAGSASPSITSVVTVVGSKASTIANISPNDWIELHGTNLYNGTATDWSQQDFSKGLPTSLNGVTATVNGKPAAIYYVSSTQINILTPLDTATGTVNIQLSTPSGNAPVYTATMLVTTPSLFVIDAAGHAAARHSADYSLVGPSSLAAAFTPAKPNEVVLLYGGGLGQTTPPITNQLTGTGLLATNPTVTVGGIPAQVLGAAISAAGLYQINIVVPSNAPDGDLPIVASYNGVAFETGVLLTVQH